MIEQIQQDLRSMAEPDYQKFQSKLMSTVCQDAILGVRVPELRKYAKSMTPDAAKQFIHTLPHRYYEENTLHAILIENISDFDLCMAQLESFLPYVDNWATCDGMKPKCFRKNKARLKAIIPHWLKADHVYTVRYGALMLMTHFLDSDFSEDCLELVAAVKGQDYYIRMGIAWYFATALAKQWDSTIVYLQNQKLDPWVHNKTIQKAIESCRITLEQKNYLRTMRV